MSPNLQHPPLWRVLRTALALVVALGGLTPAVVAALEALGVEVDGPLVLAIGSVAVLVATKVTAALADAGNVPVWRTLGQVLAALAAVVTPATVALASAGVELDAAQLTGILAGATLLVSALQNTLEARGVMPELGIPDEAALLVATSNGVREADGPQPGADPLVDDLLDDAGTDAPEPAQVASLGFVGGVRRALSGGARSTRIRADVAKVLATARSQAGVSEDPPYSNRTPYTAWYGLTGPWCAMFVSWVFWHAGYPLPPIRTAKGFAYCPDVVNWAKRNGLWRPVNSGYRPSPGDLVLFDFPGDGVNRPSHVGIVERVLPDGRISTWEGNTSSGGGRDGGSVVNHRRSVAGGIIGYVQVDSTVITQPPVKPRAERWLPFRYGDSDASIARRGGLGTQVTELQMILTRLARLWAAPELDPGPIDGEYGRRTAAAVQAFKHRIRGLQRATGQAVWSNEDSHVGPQTIGAARWWNGVTGEGR